MLFVVGCGGDDGGVKLPDAKVYMDAPVDTIPGCSVMMSLGSVSFASSGTPAAGNWFGMTSSGTKYFQIPGKLDMSETPDLLVFTVFEGTGYTTGTPYNFDPNPTSTTPTAISLIFENYNFTAKTFTRVMYASSGSITLNAIGKTMGSAINGTVTAANYREVNSQSGADVPGGCTSSLTGVQFWLSQNTTAPRVVPGGWLTPQEIADLPSVFPVAN
jgi:hypothetical protein